MKISISLTAEDLEALDEHVHKTGLGSRSAAVHQAIKLLRRSGLEEDYAAAWEEWDNSGERNTWEPVLGDGIV